MKGIDIIIPVHMYNEEVYALLRRCLNSVNFMAEECLKKDIKVDVKIVGVTDIPENIYTQLENPCVFNSFNIIENTTGNMDFCSQVNFGVEQCKNDYFMIVEYDDMVTPKWVVSAIPYMEQHQKCPIFLPLNEIYDINENKKPIGYLNEIGWSSSFVDNELGSLTNDLLKEYYNFNITGGIIKKNEFKKAGGLKPSIKISFGYELLLRLSNLYSEVFIIPKVGYFHFINRPDSLTSYYHSNITQEEGAWWIKLATQEYHFKKDRNKEYNPNEE